MINMDDLERLKSKISDAEIKDNIEMCSCPNCGHEEELCIDEISCDQKPCRMCETKMMTSLNQQNNDLLSKIKEETTIEGKFKILVESAGEFAVKSKTKLPIEPIITKDSDNEKRLFNRLEETDHLNKDINYKSKYHCKDCGIVVSASVFESESVCPKCGKDFAILEDVAFLDTERRFHCPKCSTSTKYSKITEDTCVICNSLMTVFGKPTIKNSKTPLPID